MLSGTLLLACAPAFAATRAPRPPAVAAPAQLEAIRAYIHGAWDTLTRSNASLALAAADPKLQAKGAEPVVYLPADEDPVAVRARLKAEMRPDDWARIDLRVLPDGRADAPAGLLYVPKPYVVPGGRFNELYGWDSYFILVGLVRDGRLQLAKDVTDDFLYEVRHYGRVLNANRTYYLTRSQPPFLAAMVRAVYARTKDRPWLENALPALESTYRYWTEAPHLVAATGLSRYYDSGEGPAPEVLAGEKDAEGRTHYDRVKEHLKTHKLPEYPLDKEYDAKTDSLTPFFYKNDRSMRESGFDPSDRFGPFNSEVIDINPVCLNSLLFRMETDMAAIERELGDGGKAGEWLGRAAARRERVNRLLWDEKDGLYYDYDFTRKALRPYPFVTTFYPLWAGLADTRQAARVRANLPLFERPGGLVTSARTTGEQWDAPFGWAPMQLIGVEGLRRYGFHEDADRVSIHFLSMVLKEFIAHHAIVEKYDVVRRTSQLAAGLKFGYGSNEIGFGWTNAVFEELYARLPKRRQARVLDLNPGQ
ncbi:MAG: trehalase family glycosidase [Elusimicrobia bacterium]|nr:trehalase family glycosidase [Elusimicrobiota bacterium]